MLRRQALGVQDFAFLRSCLLGLDPQNAWQRYLAGSEGGSEPRRAEQRRDALLRQVLDAGRTLPVSRQTHSALALLARARQANRAAATLPTLDEFIETEGLDREFYSEAELLQQYREHHHLDGAARAPRDAADAHVQALLTVESLLARPPAAGDAVEAWFVPALAAPLRSAGCGTLAALVETINTRGYRWYRQVPKLGERRARAIGDWLAAAGQGFGASISAAARRRPPPLPALAAPARGAAALPPDDAEPQAVRAWLARHDTRPATLRAYAKEIERFRLWTRRACGKSLLAVDGADCDAYRLFLAAVPQEWVCARPVARSDPAWRPFRGPLKPASQRLALAAARSFFDSLDERATNPVPRTVAAERRPAAVSWDRLIDAVRRRGAESARDRRLLLILLLARAGVPPTRMAEPALPESLDGELLAALQRHHADAAACGALPSPAPWVCRLREPPPAWLPAADGALLLQPRGVGGPLTPGAIRRAILRFRARSHGLAENFRDGADGFTSDGALSVKEPSGC